MKPPSLLATTVVLSSTVDSSALRSSVRGGTFLHLDEVQDHTEQHERRQEEQGATYWWLNKKSSEKDIVYKASEGESESNDKDSFSIFTIAVDNNPDTSDLPYTAPSKTPTPKPTSSPTETNAIPSPSETAIVQLAPPLDLQSHTKQLDGGTYHYPIWTDLFKGCTSSSSAPEVYNSFSDEYLFPSAILCCQTWFESDDCSTGSDMIVKSSAEQNLDEWMFKMNGIEAYSGGGDSSKDYSSQDGPAPTPVSIPDIPSVEAVVTGAPTYKPTDEGEEVDGFPDISVVTSPPVATIVTSPPVATISTSPPVATISTSPPVASPQ